MILLVYLNGILLRTLSTGIMKNRKEGVRKSGNTDGAKLQYE